MRRHHRPGFLRACRLAGLLCAALLAAGVVRPAPVLAQGEALRGLNPQAIADISSPRATLRSFLDLSGQMIGAWRAEGASDRVYVLLQGLLGTLDFSATVDGATVSEQLRRTLLLREILDRTDLPPLDEVPGRAAAQEGLAGWTVPGTALRIARVADGPRAGGFRFDSETVAALHMTYRRVQSTAYKPGALPILQEWEASGSGALYLGDEDWLHRLSWIDVTSPQSVLTEFLKQVNLAFQIASEAEAGLTASPPAITVAEARAAEARALAHLLRASNAFDLSRVPEGGREDVRIEATLALKEILDRVPLPSIASVPDANAVRRAGDDTMPFSWRFPGMPVAISRVLEGDRAGDFTFDGATLDQLADTYARLRDLPYAQRFPLRSIWEYGGADAQSPGFYETYVTTPGSLVPSASPLGRFVIGLPDWTKQVIGEQTRWQWIGLALTVLLATAVSAAIAGVAGRIAQARTDPAAAWVKVIWPLAAMVVFDRAGRFIDADLNISGFALQAVIVTNRILLLSLAAWFIWRLFMALSATLAMRRGMRDRGIDASLVRILFGLVAITVSVGLVVAGLRDIGVDAVPLIAGLGVGGLAVALAVRPTLENLIGGLILHSDRPLRIGDFCDIGGIMGTVEGIGVRSTRIRALDRTLVSIPNARLSDMDIVNFAHCDRMLINETVGLRYETTPDQIRHLLAGIRRMLHAHPKVDRDTVRVRYAGPAVSSRNIGIRIYILTRDWNEYHALREDIFLRIDDLVTASGVGYAFPSQTLYMARDQKPDADHAARAEAEVATWRTAGRLPFPRLSEAEMHRLEGTLDYPPTGSEQSVQGVSGTGEAPEPLSAGDAAGGGTPKGNPA